MSLNDSKKVGFLGQTLSRALVLLITLSGFILVHVAHTQPARTQLSDLEAFVERYPNVKALLVDAKGLHEYRELLKSYMGYNHEFDPIFETTIEQMRILVRLVPNFGEQIWANQAAGEPAVKIEASSVKRSGVETKSSVLESRLEEQRTLYETEAAKILSLSETQQLNTVAELSRSIQNQFQEIQARYSKEIKNPSGTLLSRFTNEQRKLRQQYIQEKRDFFQKSDDVRNLHAYLKYKISSDERWKDRYRSPFAEDSLSALANLHTLTHVEEELGDIKLDPLFLDGLRFVPKDALISKQQLEFEEAKDVIKKINKIKDAKPDAEILAELNQILHQNPHISASEAKAKLSPYSRKALDDFYAERQNVYRAKKNLAQGLKGAYELPVTDQKDQLKFALRDQISRDIVLRPARAFHAVFSGHLTKECVGGVHCDGLTPRRWALSALKGVRTYLAEKSGVFDGALRLVKVEFPIGSERYYDDVDAMLKSMDSTMHIRSTVTRKSAKYPAFDAILDQLTPSKDSLGFVVGDGKAISQNTGLSAVYESSPSVVAADIVKKTSIRPADHEMEKAINKVFKETPLGYNPGGMIYEAMSNDGQQIFHLKPRPQRRKHSKEELEEMLFKDALKDALEGQKNFLAKSAAWHLAVESDVSLGDLSDYQLNAENLGKSNTKIKRLVSEGNQQAIEFVANNANNAAIADKEMVEILSQILNRPINYPGINIQSAAASALKDIMVAETTQKDLVTQVLDVFTKVLQNPSDSITADDARWSVSRSIIDLVKTHPDRMDLITTEIIDGLNKKIRESNSSLFTSTSARQIAADALMYIAMNNSSKVDLVIKISAEFLHLLHETEINSLHSTAAKALTNIVQAHSTNIILVNEIIEELSKALRNPISSEVANNARWSVARELSDLINTHPSITKFITKDILHGLVKTLHKPIATRGDAAVDRGRLATAIKYALKHHPKINELITPDILRELLKIKQSTIASVEAIAVSRHVSEILKTMADHMALPENQKALARLLRSMKRSGPEYNWIPSALMNVFAEENIIGNIPQQILSDLDTRSTRQAVATERQTLQQSCTQLLQLIYLKHK